MSTIPPKFHPTTDLRQMAWQARFQIEKVTRKQSLAEHSYFVAVYADLLAKHIKWNGDIGELLSHALYHDLEEVVSGDIPTPIKAQMKQSPDFWDSFCSWIKVELLKKFPWFDDSPTDEAEFLVSVADALEALLYLLEEMSTGNGLAAPVYEYLLDRLSQKLDPSNQKVPESLRKSLPAMATFMTDAIMVGTTPNKTVK